MAARHGGRRGHRHDLQGHQDVDIDDVVLQPRHSVQRGRGGQRGGGQRGGQRGGGSQRGGQGGGGQRGGERPPPGLRGREIGLWYAQRNRKNRTEESKASKEGKFDDDRDAVSFNLVPLRLTKEHEDLPWLERRLSRLQRMDDWLSNAYDDGAFAHRYQKHLAGNVASANRLASMEDDEQDNDADDSHGDDDDTPSVKKTRTSREVQRGSATFLLDDQDEDLDYIPLQAKCSVTDKGNCNESPLSASFKHRLDAMHRNPGYKSLLAFRKKLPAFQMRESLIRAIRENEVVVISGDTGCGKTTQVPQFILDSCMSSGTPCRILCTQPRRISAVSVAERVAEERGERVGGRNSSVGYQIRLESKLPRYESGTLVYCTTGVVLQHLRSDPDLKEVTHVVMDEVHERDLLADLLITIIKLLRKRRPSLKLVLMSATINAEEFARYFNDCPILSIPGRVFRVEEFYLEDVLEKTKFVFNSNSNKKREPVWLKHTRGAKEREAESRSAFESVVMPYVRQLRTERKYSRTTLDGLSNPVSEETNKDLIVKLVHYIHTSCDEGAILVFVDGWELISNIHKELNKKLMASEAVIYPLHSLMPTATQKGIFERPAQGIRKIIVATNIAETSITVDDVVYVIDCGKIKVTNFDVETNAKTLLSQWVSLANARQRKGRAGRCREGICFHLYSKAREMTLDTYMLPEILRTRLDELILQVKILELGDFRQFLSQVMSPPNSETIEATVRMLEAIDALTSTGELTPLGFHLAHLPMDAQMGKMILLGAIFCCLDPILSIAATLSFKDPFVVPLDKEREVDERRRLFSNETKSDHLMMANLMHAYKEAQKEGTAAINEFTYDNFLQENTLKMIDRLKGQFAEHLYKAGFLNSSSFNDHRVNRNAFNENVVKAVIAAGLYPNVAKMNLFKMAKYASTKALKGQTSNRPVKVATYTEKSVSIHRKSVNCKEWEFGTPWLVFFEKIRLKAGASIFDCTDSSSIALILFGEHMKLKELKNASHKEFEIHVDPFVRFQCSKSTAFLLRKLRMELEQFFNYKITHPGGSKWNEGSKEGCLLKTVVQVFDMETNCNSGIEY